MSPTESGDPVPEMIAIAQESQNVWYLDQSPQFLSPVTGSMLVLAHWLPTMDRSAGGLRAFSILQILCEERYNVVLAQIVRRGESLYIKLSEHVSLFGSKQQLTQYEGQFGQLKIEIIYGSKAILRHLHEKGYEYQFVFLSYPEVAYQ